jgi:hypothetical protein
VTAKRKPLDASHFGTTELDRVSVKVGRLASASAPEALVVEFDGGAFGPLAARSLVTLDAPAISEAVASRRPVVVLFEDGDPRRPIVVGIFPADPGATLFGALLSPRKESSKPPEARVDGTRVVLEGKEEVVLKCGDASITLRRDGKVMLRGVYVETNATGLNRIKGASVKIN